MWLNKYFSFSVLKMVGSKWIGLDVGQNVASRVDWIRSASCWIWLDWVLKTRPTDNWDCTNALPESYSARLGWGYSLSQSVESGGNC